MIGWVPYVARWRHLRNTSVGRYAASSACWPHVKSWLMYLICRTGNPTPPDSFASAESFRTYLTTREFRGAICLENVRFERAENGAFGVSSGNDLGEEGVGYTPVPYRGGLLWRRRVLFFWRGESYPGGSPGVLLGHRPGTPISYVSKRLYFRVDRPARALPALFGVKVPYAWVQVTVTYNRETGESAVSLTGSAVPSRAVSWRLSGRPPRHAAPYDMLWADPATPGDGTEGVQGFFESPGLVAPEFPFESVFVDVSS
ncbi:MAG: hypothetical protein U0835_13410 [Isosphaeraceae bacterium]